MIKLSRLLWAMGTALMVAGVWAALDLGGLPKRHSLAAFLFAWALLQVSYSLQGLSRRR